MSKMMKVDVVIIGGSTGGCAAAIAAAKTGKQVILVEETAWIGGQLTNQAVPPDENPWIEEMGCTRSYREFRNRVRDYYKTNYPMTEEAKQNPRLNPGNGIVSLICHEPKVALAVLEDMLAPYVANGNLQILTKYIITSAEVDGDYTRSVTIRNVENNDALVLTAPYFLDATECGDVLPLAGVEYVTGSESKQQTGEPHALDGEADPLDMQGITYVFAMDYIEGEDHTIERPKDYDFWREYKADFWPDKQLSWMGVHPPTQKPMKYELFAETGFSLWRYRRIIDKTLFEPGTFVSDITLVNWPQNDYWLGPVIDAREEERSYHLDKAKQLSLSYLYWMQTEAPRPDGKVGYPGLRLRKDLLGTEDGLAMYPYIRESRRIQAEFTIVEQHVSRLVREDRGPERFHDSVGIGFYSLDLHPSTGGRNYIDIPCYPFQIPLGSLLPIRMENLLPASKNIGTTHITNGCYRLHPIEWNIGEASGYLASYCIEHNVKPREVRNNINLLEDFQQFLVREGIELAWPQKVIDSFKKVTS